MRTLRLSLYVAVLLLVPSIASAGPIYFTSQLLSDTDPGINGGAGLFTITHTRSLPQFIDPATSPDALYATMSLTPQVPSRMDSAEPGPLSGKTTFWIALNLTDSESGASGQLKLTGYAWSDWSQGAETTPGGSGIVFDQSGYTDKMLGSNNFRFYSEVSADGASAQVRLKLAPSVTVADSPEPGTLILAGLGLMPAFGLYLRRRVR